MCTWVANRLIMGAFEGPPLFTRLRSRRIALAEKFRGIWEVSRGGPPFLTSAIDASPVSTSSTARSNPLNKE